MKKTKATAIQKRPKMLMIVIQNNPARAVPDLTSGWPGKSSPLKTVISAVSWREEKDSLDSETGREGIFTDIVGPIDPGTKEREGKLRSGSTARISRVRITIVLLKGADLCLKTLTKSQPTKRMVID